MIFSKPILCKEVGFLCCIQCIITLLLSYPKQLSDIFSDFSSKVETLLRGAKISLSRLIVVLQSKLKMFCDQGVKYYTKTASGTHNITKVHFCLYLVYSIQYTADIGSLCTPVYSIQHTAGRTSRFTPLYSIQYTAGRISRFTSVYGK